MHRVGCRDQSHIAALAFHVGDAERNRLVVVGDFTANIQQPGVIDEDRRIVAGDGGLEQALHVARRRRNCDLQTGNIPQHGLGTAGVLRRAAAAQAVKKMEHHRHARLAAGHGKSVGRFVGDLRPGFINKTAGAEIDDRP